MPSPDSKPLGDAVAEAAREASRLTGKSGPDRPAAGRVDAIGSELRRRELIPLLVLHLIRVEPSYGNHLIETIGDLTQGVITVNPNTMYPLLRKLESGGLIEGNWEHPDRRTRRFYSITPDGEREYRRLADELEPVLDAVIRSVGMIKSAVYGDG